jgi:hypothetical protein
VEALRHPIGIKLSGLLWSKSGKSFRNRWLATTGDPKKDLPMDMLSRVGWAMQQLVGPLVGEAAKDSGVIQRRRTLTAASLARMFVFGFLRTPRATDEELAQVAAVCGTPVTPQAVEQRHTPRLLNFLERLFRGTARSAIGSDRALAPILERFLSVTVLDSSSLRLPDGQAEAYPGCGGRPVGASSYVDIRSRGFTPGYSRPPLRGEEPSAISPRLLWRLVRRGQRGPTPAARSPAVGIGEALPISRINSAGCRRVLR